MDNRRRRVRFFGACNASFSQVHTRPSNTLGPGYLGRGFGADAPFIAPCDFAQVPFSAVAQPIFVSVTPA
jgi:hypothetical protein